MDEYNVRSSYGAKGDGVTDDTAAIQAAVNDCQAAGGGTVYFPPGIYLVTPTTGPALTVGSNVLLRGSNRKSSAIRKNADGVLISMSGTSSTARVSYSSIQSLSVTGNFHAGSLLQLYYADNLVFRDVYMANNADTVIDTAEFWDSRFENCVWESSGGVANSVTPNVYLRNSAAASGFGYSSDNTNQIYFHACRWENFFTGAVRIDAGVNSTNNANGIYFTDCKMETSKMRGGSHLFAHASARQVYVNHLYCYAGGFDTGYSTPQNIIVWSPQSSALENVMIANSTVATINSGVDLFSGAAGSAVLRNVVGTYTTAPTGAHLFYEASSTADFNIENCYGTTGAQAAGTVPIRYAGNSPVKLVAGAVTDAAFTRAPVDGTLAIDSTNGRLYVRIGGLWKSVAVA